MAATKRVPIKITLYKALKYITDEEKTDGKILISGLNGSATDARSAYKEMRFTKQLFQKTDKIQAHHFIQSFSPGEATPENAHELGMEWAKEIFGDKFQGVLSTHIDKEHIHNHIIINSVSYLDGTKYYSNKGEYKFIKQKSDDLCLKYGLSIIVPEVNKEKAKNKKSQKEYYDVWNEKKVGDINTVQEDIDATISVSDSFEKFISNMKKQGYQIKYGENIKHISFKNPEMNKAIRGRSIGEEYTEENIKNRVAIKSLDLSKSTNEENSSWEKITINKKLIKDVTDDHFYTKVPFQKLHVKYDIAEAVWKNENTILVKIDTNRNYTVVDNQKEITISGLDLFKYYDDAAKNFKNRNNDNNNFKLDNLDYDSITEDLNLENDFCLITNDIESAKADLFNFEEETEKMFKIKGNNPNEKRFDSYGKKSDYKNNFYKPKRYTCKNKNVFLRHKKHCTGKIFSKGKYRWNYSRPSSRNSLLVLLLLLKTKSKFERRQMDITPVVKMNNDRVIKNSIKNIQINLSLMDKYQFENISDVNHTISNIEEKKKVNFKQIKLIEERHIKNKIIYDLTEEYIRYKPAYVNYKQKTGIKTDESTEFVRIYNVLKNFEIDNETKILEFRSALDDIQEDLDNDITDFKEKNRNLNKEKFKIEKIKETVMDMKEKKYDLPLAKNRNFNKEKKYGIERR